MPSVARRAPDSGEPPARQGSARALTAFPQAKCVRTVPTPRSGNGPKAAAFRQLMTSIRQAGEIRRGERMPSRVTVFRRADVKRLRAELGQTQAEPRTTQVRL